MIDLFRPYIPKGTIEAVSDVLHTRWIGQGPKVDIFEKNFSNKFNQDYCVSVNSGTAALETIYDILDLKEGDEVISTPLTCTATNLPLLKKKVKIVWADIDKNTLCIDLKDVKKKITNNTKAVIQVHLGGIQAKLKNLSIPIISDACQALGIFVGDYTACSFQAIKHLTTGDGGMVVLPNEKEYRQAKLLRWFGIDRAKKIANNWQAYTQRQMTFDIEVLGSKRHMNDIAAIMGIVGLTRYDDCIEYRKKLFNLYKKNLKNIKDLKIIDDDNNTYWLCTLLVERRDDFAKKLFEAHIDTNVVQVRNDIYKVFSGQRSNLPIMNEIEYKYISIPLGMHVTESDIEYICSIIRKGW